jgi:predicted ester cyclase
MQDEEFDEKVHHKARVGNNSGYLDEEYELTKEFPSIPEYHFRIEDDAEILNL